MRPPIGRSRGYYLRVRTEDQATLLHQLRNVGALLAATALFFVQVRHPVVISSSRVVNEAIGCALAFILPWLVLVRISFLWRWWARALAIVLVLPLLLYTFVAPFFMLILTNSSVFDRFAETEWKRSAVRQYRVNGGATTDFGVEIRHERAILPGVLIVRTLDTFYPCHSLKVVSTSEGVQIEDDRSDCESFSGQRRSYRLKRFVYF
jgi:hypothetical protein